MKTFLASLLASAAVAANTKNWSGTAATGGDITATPKASSSWSGTASSMVVTYTTTTTLSKTLSNDDYVQTWWCMPYNSKMDCNLWQWEMDGTNYIIKGKNYQKSTTTLDNSIPTLKPKAYFDKSGNGYTAETAIEYKQTGNNTTPAKTSATNNTYTYASSKVNSKTLTGAFKRTYTASQTGTIETSGLSATGYIGVYVNDKSKTADGKIKKNVSMGVAKKPVPAAPTTVNGAKKTWVGPSVTHADNTAKAGGWTKWTKTGTALQSWMCQTGTATTALTDDDWTIQTYLWEKSTDKFWIWTFRNNEFKYYEMTDDIATFEQGKSPKKQLDTADAVVSSKIYYENVQGTTTWAVDPSQNVTTSSAIKLDTTNTSMDAAKKVFTGCMQTDSTSTATKEKGSTKSYTQGVWYSKESDKEGKHVEKDVSVVIAAEGSATTILTTLGAVAATVAALAY